jgi:hypothetical protein
MRKVLHLMVARKQRERDERTRYKIILPVTAL